MEQFVVVKPRSVPKDTGTVVRLIQGAGGTCLQGYVTSTYAQIKKILGPHNLKGDGYKVSTEWNIEFTEPNGTRTVATIYDWKEEGLRCRRGSYQWHIGGMNKRAVELVQQLLAA
jgi:hypothetical protein